MAHSAGGECLAAIQRAFSDTFYDQVSKIALTDSVTVKREELTRMQLIFMFSKAIHYEASSEELGEVLRANAEVDLCPVLSAGDERHEYTPGTAMPLILDQFGYVVPP